MKLSTTSLHPLAVEIDGKTYTCECINLGDMESIAQTLVAGQREAVNEDFNARIAAESDAGKRTELDKERIKAYNSIEPKVPGEVLVYLLDSLHGQTLTLFAALRKKHPEVTFDFVRNLAWNDDLVQLVYDLLHIKRRLADKSAEEAKAPVNPPKPLLPPG